MKKFIVFILIAVLVLPLVSFAKVGVGVGTGKIEADAPLKPGGIYNLSSLMVINTGDETSDYKVKVTYHSKQSEMRPDEEWFSFKPSLFTLEPGQFQNVAIELILPMKTEQGDYFAYLKAVPVIEKKAGTTVGVAAAAKIYFSVVPANILQAITYRISCFFVNYAPWSWVVLAVTLVAIAITLFKKYFSFQIGVKKKEK